MADSNTFDPNAQTVAEVNEYLAQADATEAARVLEAEEGGQKRVGILNGAEAQKLAAEGTTDAQADANATTSTLQSQPETVKDETEAKETTTKGGTFQEAAKAATPSEVGYLGYSPERERTGREDKGLSQRNTAVMTGGTIPDPRQGVDDSEALEA